MVNPSNPLIVQSDKSVLLEVDNPLYEDARDSLARFAELVKSPEYVHTYRVTPLSLWNAAAMGMIPDEVIAALEKFAKYPIPGNIAREIIDYMSRYGQLSLYKEGPDLLLLCEDDEAKIAEAEEAAINAIKARIRFWDGVLQAITHARGA